jgi:hypothetical protein
MKETASLPGLSFDPEDGSDVVPNYRLIFIVLRGVTVQKY